MIQSILKGLTRILTGAQIQSKNFSFEPETQRIYFANHSSHLDTLLLWSLIPANQRCKVRPAAAKDYWWSSPIRRYLAEKVFHAIPVIRQREDLNEDPLKELDLALKNGESLIFFPEGTRGSGEVIQPFKSGLYHLVFKYPNVDLVPIYIRNLNRVLPKGEFLPVPIFCTVTFGESFRIGFEENKADFLIRAHKKLEELSKE